MQSINSGEEKISPDCCNNHSSRGEYNKNCDFISRLPGDILYKVCEIYPLAAVIIPSLNNSMSETKQLLDPLAVLEEERLSIIDLIDNSESKLEGNVINILRRKLLSGKARYAIPLIKETVEFGVTMVKYMAKHDKISIKFLRELEDAIIAALTLSELNKNEFWAYLIDLLSNDPIFAGLKIDPILQNNDLEHLESELIVMYEFGFNNKHTSGLQYDMNVVWLFIDLIGMLHKLSGHYGKDMDESALKIISKNFEALLLDGKLKKHSFSNFHFYDKHEYILEYFLENLDCLSTDNLISLYNLVTSIESSEGRCRKIFIRRDKRYE